MTCWLPAGCILRLRNAVEVALALRLVARFGATFAVRGAGHQPNVGFSSVGAHGVLLDLAALDQIALTRAADDSVLAEVGPSATWDAIYDTIEPEGLTVVGGRAAGVGVAGLISGGT